MFRWLCGISLLYYLFHIWINIYLCICLCNMCNYTVVDAVLIFNRWSFLFLDIYCKDHSRRLFGDAISFLHQEILMLVSLENYTENIYYWNHLVYVCTLYMNKLSCVSIVCFTVIEQPASLIQAVSYILCRDTDMTEHWKIEFTVIVRIF